jgi:hypothetical protein
MLRECVLSVPKIIASVSAALPTAPSHPRCKFTKLSSPNKKRKKEKLN